MLGQKLRTLFVLLALICMSLIAAEVTKEEQRAFESLVRAVEKEGGFVHPSIGLVAPAPSGAPRGIGIVKKIKKTIDDGILMKIPYTYQLTRHLALSTLSALVPPIVLVDLPLTELDDAALLVLLLAHEYGLGKKSKFYAFLKTLPIIEGGGGCGWVIDDFRNLPAGVEVEDIEGAVHYSHRVATGMANDYSEYLSSSAWPKEWKEDASLALQWGLCVVASRGTAANLYPGDSGASGVRLVPLADMANHQVIDGGYIEDDAGAFEIRSRWKDYSAKQLAVGDEITVNYNLPEYRPADWFVSLGFVPPEVVVRVHQEL